MKKRLWLGFAVVPILLLGFTWWARHESWRRLEDDLRRDVLIDAVRYGGRNVKFGVCAITTNRRYPLLLARWNEQEMSEFLSDIHVRLRPPQNGEVEDISNQYTILYGGENSEWYGVLLNANADKGDVSFSDSNLDNKWKRFSLTPESCIALKSRLWAQYGTKLRTLKLLPPQ